MKSIVIDFSKKYIGTIARQGEHNKTQLVFTLPDTFVNADYVNAEFRKSNNSNAIVEFLVPENGVIAIPLTQELTDVADCLCIQLVAYVADDTEITEIAKSLTVQGVIRPSLNVLYNQGEQGFIERVLAFVREWAGKLPDLWAVRHTHSNQPMLDTITQQTLTDIGSNTAARHTHTNKAVLDTITQQTLTDIVSNTAARHTHSNQINVLDYIDAVKSNSSDLGLTDYNVLRYRNKAVNGYRYNTLSFVSGGSFKLYAGEVTFIDVSAGGSLYISDFINEARYECPEYILHLKTGTNELHLYVSASPVIHGAILWPVPYEFKANCLYQISIMNHIALWCAVEMEEETT